MDITHLKALIGDLENTHRFRHDILEDIACLEPICSGLLYVGLVKALEYASEMLDEYKPFLKEKFLEAIKKESDKASLQLRELYNDPLANLAGEALARNDDLETLIEHFGQSPNFRETILKSPHRLETFCGRLVFIGLVHGYKEVAKMTFAPKLSDRSALKEAIFAKAVEASEKLVDLSLKNLSSRASTL